ncbi:MAG: HRDC domain-containing protein, partial [Paludibacteraceae bacterium]|nr:HRDC domain-containing protein [Paludibacteraceae bacterium]
LHYFGEEYNDDNCGNCDNCRNPKKTVEAKEELITILELVEQLKEKFKAEHIISILLGKKTKDIEAHEHDELDSFGSFPDQDERTLDTIIHQAMIAGFIAKDIENYGLLKITKAGKDFLKKPTSFKISKNIDMDEEDEETDMPTIKAGGGAADEVLFSMLKDLRKKVSKDLKVPPYVIFQDPSLEAMATSYPINLDELQNIPGVGAGKAKRYGQKFVELIKRHVEENDITRPEDIRVKSVANKSKQKIAIIQAIDRKIPLDDIAANHDLEIDELLDELETIVDSGTKINIDYFIYDVMDEDRVEEVYEYFKEAESDSIEDAITELGPEDYTEEEIRFVRIK